MGHSLTSEVIMNKPRRSSRWLWLLIFVFIPSLSVLAGDETTDKVDKVFAQWGTTTSPGCALAVIRDGRIIYKRGYGMARI
jgi:CubicO group peptidase (beta-lactamase class C family)